MTTTPHAELPAHMVFIDQYDDSTFGSITDDAWGRDESSELKLGAPLYTAGQMRAYADARERALLARLGEQQPVAWDRADQSDPISVAKKYGMENHNGKPGKALASLYTVPLFRHPSPAPVGAQEREAILRAAVAAMPHTNPLVADDLIEGHTMHTEAEDIIAIWQAARSAAQGAVQVPAWVSVHDALPAAAEDEDVPVWTWDGISVNEDNYGPIFEQPAGPAVGGWLNVGHGFVGDTMGRVTHWMPRPTPAAPAHAGERSEGGA